MMVTPQLPRLFPYATLGSNLNFATSFASLAASHKKRVNRMDCNGDRKGRAIAQEVGRKRQTLYLTDCLTLFRRRKLLYLWWRVNPLLRITTSGAHISLRGVT